MKNNSTGEFTILTTLSNYISKLCFMTFLSVIMSIRIGLQLLLLWELCVWLMVITKSNVIFVTQGLCVCSKIKWVRRAGKTAPELL